MTEISYNDDQKTQVVNQCHLAIPNFVKLRGKSSDLPLKNIWGNKFAIKLSELKKWEFMDNPNKLYNAAKFAIMQMSAFTKPEQYDKSTLLPVDRWILQRVNETTIKVTSMLNNYEIGQARHEIDNLFWRDFCDYYIEIAKERLYQLLIHGTEQRYSGQIAVYYGLLGILKLYALYTPYVTEYIYQDFYRKQEKEISLHETLWETTETDEIYI